MLDKASPVPLYYQLAELIRERIAAGEFAPGAQLPAERELSEQAAISRMTARQAVAYLVRQGVLVVKPGVGTFVAAPKLTYDALHLLSFTEESMRQGGRVHSRVLEQLITPAPPRVTQALMLAPNAHVVKLVRVRFMDETPMLIESSWLPAQICSHLAQTPLEMQSLYAVLAEQYGLHLQGARQTIEATNANQFEATLFGVPADSAMLLLEGVAHDEQGRPVEYFKAIYRGDRFKFALENRRMATGAPHSDPQVSVIVA